MASSHPSPTDGPETGFSDGGDEDAPRRGESKRKRFHPFRAVRNIFRRAKRHGPEEETGANKKSRSTSELSSVQVPTDIPTFPGLAPPYAAGLSVSHDSIFSPDHQLALDSGATADQQAASSRSMQHVRLKGFKDELFTRVRARRDSDDDPGLPSSPCTSPTTADVLAQGLHDQPSHSRSTCSAGSLISMGSSDNDDDSGGFMSSSHSSRMSLLDKRPFDFDADMDVAQPVPLNHNAARHKMSVRPKRTHSVPRHRKLQQMAVAAGVGSLPSTPEVTEDYLSAFAKAIPPVEKKKETQDKEAPHQQSAIPSSPQEALIFEIPKEIAKEIPIEKPSTSLELKSVEETTPEPANSELAKEIEKEDSKPLIENNSECLSVARSPSPAFMVDQSPPSTTHLDHDVGGREEMHRGDSPERPLVKGKGKSNAAELKLRHEIKQYSKRVKEQKEMALTAAEGLEVIEVKDCCLQGVDEENEISKPETEEPVTDQATGPIDTKKLEEKFTSTIIVSENSCTLQSNSDETTDTQIKEGQNVMVEVVPVDAKANYDTSVKTNSSGFSVLSERGHLMETHKSESGQRKVDEKRKDSDGNKYEEATGKKKSIGFTQETENTSVEKMVNKQRETVENQEWSVSSEQVMNTLDIQSKNASASTQNEANDQITKKPSHLDDSDNVSKPELMATSVQTKESRGDSEIISSSSTVFASGDFEGIMKKRRSMTESEVNNGNKSIQRALSEDVASKTSSTNRHSGQRLSVEIVPFNTRNKDPNYLLSPAKNSEESNADDKKDSEVKPETDYPPVELRRKHSFNTTKRLMSSDIPVAVTSTSSQPPVNIPDDPIEPETSVPLNSGSQLKYPVQFRIRRGKSLNEKCGAGQLAGKETTVSDKSQMPRPKSQILPKEGSPNPQNIVPEFMKIQLRSSREELDNLKAAGDPVKSGSTGPIAPVPVNSAISQNTPQWEVKIGQSKSQLSSSTSAGGVSSTQGVDKPNETPNYSSVIKMAPKEDIKMANKDDKKDSENKENIGNSNVLVKDESMEDNDEEQNGEDYSRVMRSAAIKDDGRRKSQSFTGVVTSGSGGGADPEPELFRVFARRSIKQRKQTKTGDEGEKKADVPTSQSTPSTPVNTNSTIGKEEETALPASRFERPSWKPASQQKSEPKPVAETTKTKDVIKVEKAKTDLKSSPSTPPVESPVSKLVQPLSKVQPEVKPEVEETTSRSSIRVNLDRSRFSKVPTQTSTPPEPQKPPRRKSSGAGDLIDDSNRAKPVVQQQHQTVTKPVQSPPITKPMNIQQPVIAKPVIAHTPRVTVNIKPQTPAEPPQAPIQSRKTSLPESPNPAKNGQPEADPFGSNNNHIPGTPTWMQLAQQRREQREQKERMMYGSSANTFVLDTSNGSKPSRNSKVLDLVNNFQKLQTT